MNRQKYIICTYTFLVIIISTLFYIVYEVNSNKREEKIFSSLFSFNKNGKLDYEEIVTSDTSLINKNIGLQLSKINFDSCKICKYFFNDSVKDFSGIIKFTLNSFLHLKVSVEDVKSQNDTIIEMVLYIKNFNNLPLSIVFRKEQEKYKLININNIDSYLKCLDILYSQ